jgi:hypothetical protein
LWPKLKLETKQDVIKRTICWVAKKESTIHAHFRIYAVWKQKCDHALDIMIDGNGFQNVIRDY